MILVTLGTQDKPFTRLLNLIQEQINFGNIKDKVIVQGGCTKFSSKDMEIFDLLDLNTFDKLIKEADIVITHGGVGSILTALKNNKKVIAVARLKKYNEHTNDHQTQIIDIMTKEGYILKYEDGDFAKILKSIKTFKPKKYKSNTINIINAISKFIDENKKEGNK